MSKAVHDALREKRIKSKLTQKQVADVLNITQRAYAHYETGDREPSIQTLIRLADYYDTSLDTLTGRYSKK